MCFSALSASNLHKVVCIPKWFVKRCASKKSVFKLQYGNQLYTRKHLKSPGLLQISLCVSPAHQKQMSK